MPPHDRIDRLNEALEGGYPIERFLAEIKTTANLQHPHILTLFDSGEADSFTELRERMIGS